MIMTTVTIGNRCPAGERLEEERGYEVYRMSVAGAGNEGRLTPRRQLPDLRERVRAIGERSQADTCPNAHAIARGIARPELRYRRALLAKPVRQVTGRIHRLEGSHLDPVWSGQLALAQRFRTRRRPGLIRRKRKPGARRGRLYAGDRGELDFLAY